MLLVFEYECKDVCSLTHQVSCLTLKGASMELASANKGPDDGRRDHTSGTTTQDNIKPKLQRNLNNNLNACKVGLSSST